MKDKIQGVIAITLVAVMTYTFTVMFLKSF